MLRDALLVLAGCVLSTAYDTGSVLLAIVSAGLLAGAVLMPARA